MLHVDLALDLAVIKPRLPAAELASSWVSYDTKRKVFCPEALGQQMRFSRWYVCTVVSQPQLLQS